MSYEMLKQNQIDAEEELKKVLQDCEKWYETLRPVLLDAVNNYVKATCRLLDAIEGML